MHKLFLQLIIYYDDDIFTRRQNYKTNSVKKNENNIVVWGRFVFSQTTEIQLNLKTKRDFKKKEKS